MTTEELIEILKQHPGKCVFVDGYEGNMEPLMVDNVSVVGAIRLTETWFSPPEPGDLCGTHEACAQDDPKAEKVVIVLSRTHDWRPEFFSLAANKKPLT